MKRRLILAASLQAEKLLKSCDGSMLLYNTNELEWFSKNSYNLALKYTSTWNPRHVLRMLHCCTIFIDLHKFEISEERAADLSLRRIFCDYLAVVLLVGLARGGDNIEVQLQDYLTIRKHVNNYDAILQSKLEKLEEAPAQDLLQKLSILIAFDFEAAIQLKNWDDLSGIILKGNVCKSMKLYTLMADCILSCDASAESEYLLICSLALD